MRYAATGGAGSDGSTESTAKEGERVAVSIDFSYILLVFFDRVGADFLLGLFRATFLGRIIPQHPYR